MNKVDPDTIKGTSIWEITIFTIITAQARLFCMVSWFFLFMHRGTNFLNHFLFVLMSIIQSREVKYRRVSEYIDQFAKSSRGFEKIHTCPEMREK